MLCFNLSSHVVACIALWGGRAPLAKSLLHLPALQTLGPIGQRRIWFGVNLSAMKFHSSWFWSLVSSISWFMMIFDEISWVSVRLRPWWPLWTPPKAAFQSSLAAVCPQGDPRVAPWWCAALSVAGHSLSLLGKEFFNVVQVIYYCLK